MSPPAAPITAGRQPRATPAASTIVVASTASTDEPRNAAAICGVAWIQVDMLVSLQISGRCWPWMPAKGDGTYDGAGGSVPHPAAIHATAKRTMRRLNVFI